MAAAGDTHFYGGHLFLPSGYAPGLSRNKKFRFTAESESAGKSIRYAGCAVKQSRNAQSECLS